MGEKPWRADAIVRLGASVVICCLMGAVVAEVFRYFGAPPGRATVWFVALSIGAFGCFGGALLTLMRPWPFESYMQKLLVLLCCVWAAFFLMWLAERLLPRQDEIENSTITVLITVLAFQGAALVLVHFFLREHHTNWAAGFGFDNNTGHALLLGACVGIIVLPVIWVILILSSLALESLNFHTHEQEIVVILRSTEGWENRLVMGIATIAIAPFAEEILFRGILYPTIKRTGHQQLALWTTALVFAAIHLDVEKFLPLAFLAIVLIYLYEYTGNLLACIAAHSLFNAANFIALYLFQK